MVFEPYVLVSGHQPSKVFKEARRMDGIEGKHHIVLEERGSTVQMRKRKSTLPYCHRRKGVNKLKSKGVSKDVFEIASRSIEG